eukprot:9628630-Alexandrium_andersonii.AAC.1
MGLRAFGAPDRRDPAKATGPATQRTMPVRATRGSHTSMCECPAPKVAPKRAAATRVPGARGAGRGEPRQKRRGR